MSQSIVGSLRRWDPEHIGPFVIIGRLGAGAMGQVYLARSAAGRLVAVKTIRIELAEEPGFRARFAREVAAARQVSGVFTAAVIAADPEADRPWVATAYVPAPSLSRLVRECGPLPVPAVRWLAAGCAEALESIHGARLLHRDVKPANVLVAPDGPRVIDFGVARAAERVQLTVTRGAAGTPAYMAPEQARDAAQASPASDVFSLGGTLVFAATGHAPYGGETVMDILVRLATEPPDLAGVPAELTALVGACLERVPRDRPGTGAILAGLGSFAAGPDGPGHAYLPDSAMALIAEYQRVPLRPLVAGRGAGRVRGQPRSDTEASEASEAAAGDDTSGSGAPVGADTSGSHTDLPGFEHVAGLDSVSWADSLPGADSGGGFAPSPAGGDTGGAAGASPPPGWARLRRWLRLPGGRPDDASGAPGRAAAGYRGGGVWPGDAGWHAGAARPAVGGRMRPAARWAIGAVAAAALVAAGTVLGMALHGSNAAASATPPPPCPSALPSSTPELCAPQSSGDGETVYVLHGSGYVPGKVVTITLVGVGSSPVRPVTDGEGTFNYAVDQGHYFFRGAIPPGTYTVVATAPGEATVRASFSVHAPPAGPPPGQPPP